VLDKLSSPSLIRINHPAHHVRLIARRARRVAQLLDARFINRVVDRGASARACLGDLVAQRPRIAGKGLDDCGSSSKVITKASSLLRRSTLKQKIDRSVLLKFEASRILFEVSSNMRCAAADRLPAEVTDFLETSHPKS